MPVEKKVSEMSLGELVAERTELLPSLKKMKRNPVRYADTLNVARRRNLLLKDEICRRKKVVDAPVVEVSPVEEAPAMLLAA